MALDQILPRRCLSYSINNVTRVGEKKKKSEIFALFLSLCKYSFTKAGCFVFCLGLFKFEDHIAGDLGFDLVGISAAAGERNGYKGVLANFQHSLNKLVALRYVYSLAVNGDALYDVTLLYLL